MATRHILVSLAIAGLWAGGCQDKNSQNARDKSLSQQAANQKASARSPLAPAPGQTDSRGGMGIDASQATAEALAAKVQNVTQHLDPLIDRRNRSTDPSAVDWIDPETLRLNELPFARSSSTAPASTPVPAVHPAGANPAVAVNQVAYAPPANASNSSVRTGGAMTAGMQIPPDAPSRIAVAGTDGALEQKLAQRIKDYPHDVAAHLDYQLFQFLSDRTAPDLESLAALSAEDRELIASTLDGLSNFRNILRSDNNTLLSRKVRPLLELADRLRGQADLSIPTLQLCTKVEGFGVYDPIDPARFPAGKENPVVLYCEVENFSTQQDEKRMWVTKLQQEAVLYTETGLPVWEDKTHGIVDLSRNRRHDFFLVKMIKLPSTLSVGRYVLKVSVVDQQANRVAEATATVQIVAQ